MSVTTYGYIRVSTKDQNEARQLDAMAPLNIPEGNLYMDKQSGKDFNRPEYLRMLQRFQPGDVLFIKSIDRLGRNYTEILEQWRDITQRKQVDVVVLDMPMLDTRKDKNLMGTVISDIVLTLLSYIAQTERENIRQRQAEGIAAAKARGVQFGRPMRPYPANWEDIYRRWKSGEIKGETAAQDCGWPMSSFRYRAGVYERQNTGCEETARGIRMGRPSRPYPENWEDIYRRWKNGEISGRAAAQEC